MPGKGPPKPGVGLVSWMSVPGAPAPAGWEGRGRPRWAASLRGAWAKAELPLVSAQTFFTATRETRIVKTESKSDSRDHFKIVFEVCFNLWLFSVHKVLSWWFGVQGPMCLNLGAAHGQVTCPIPL